MGFITALEDEVEALVKLIFRLFTVLEVLYRVLLELFQLAPLLPVHA